MKCLFITFSLTFVFLYAHWLRHNTILRFKVLLNRTLQSSCQLKLINPTADVGLDTTNLFCQSTKIVPASFKRKLHSWTEKPIILHEEFHKCDVYELSQQTCRGRSGMVGWFRPNVTLLNCLRRISGQTVLQCTKSQVRGVACRVVLTINQLKLFSLLYLSLHLTLTLERFIHKEEPHSTMV